MNLFDAFSGIGGFSLGAERAGLHFDQHTFSEVEPYAIDIYQQHFPTATNLGDITKINANKFRRGQWIFTAGFPCQDISTAGTGKGLKGKRSGLWHQLYEIIQKAKPEIIILENVPAITVRGGVEVVSSLTECGYLVEWTLLSAADVGLPHIRKRWFCVAHDRRVLRHGLATLDDSTHQDYLENGGLFASDSHRTALRLFRERAKTKGNEIHTGPALQRVDNGFSYRLDTNTPTPLKEVISRVKACGNAVTPRCTQFIFERLVDAGLLKKGKSTRKGKETK